MDISYAIYQCSRVCSFASQALDTLLSNENPEESYSRMMRHRLSGAASDECRDVYFIATDGDRCVSRLWPVFGKWLEISSNAPMLMLGTLDSMLKTTVVIAAPVIILMFLVTIGLGFINRTAPQLNVFFLSMPVKSAVGIAMLIIYLPFIMDMLIYTDDNAILEPVLKLF